MLFDLIVIAGLIVILIDVERLMGNLENNSKQNLILAKALDELGEKIDALKRTR